MALQKPLSLVGPKKGMPDGTLDASVRAAGIWVLPGILTYTGAEGAARVRVPDFFGWLACCFGLDHD